MAHPSRLFWFINEMIFVLVGALLLWVGLSGRYLFDPRSPAWLVVTAILVLWGARTLRRARLAAARVDRTAMNIDGGSLILAGLVMFSLAWTPFLWAGPLLAAAGGLFVMRGLVTATLMALQT
jgi:hypothetical protein